MKKKILTLACAVGTALLSQSIAGAATPSLVNITPRGAQRGTEVELTFRGDRLKDAQELMFFNPGITVGEFKPAEDGKSVVVKATVATDAKLGEHMIRVRTATGVSELRTFYVGALPVVEEEADLVGGDRRRRRGEAEKPPPEKKPASEKVPPSTFDKPQVIPLNVTVAGIIELEQVDFYAVECKKGQRLTVEVEGMRLGAVLDPHVTILDKNKKELALSDDTALLKQDCYASTIIPEDGTYIVQLHESSYGGSATSHYRMHVGTFPRPHAVYPAGGKAGESIEVRLIGDAKGEFKQSVKVPATPGQEWGLWAEQDGQIAPSANPFRVSAYPNVLEAEPNNEPAQASGTGSAQAPAVPVAMNGIIETPGDVDMFKFSAKKGQQLNVNVYGRRARTPLDPVLMIYNAKGAQLAANDDSGGPDPYLKFAVPDDGDYIVGVKDHLNRGGPDYVYRVEIEPVEPKLALTFPTFGVNGQPSQERQSMVVPKGNRFGTLVRATRADFGGDVTLNFEGLPPGVKMSAEVLATGLDMIPVVFEAAPDAPVGGKFCDVAAKGMNDKTEIPGKFNQVVELALSQQQNQPYYSIDFNTVAVAVAEEAPFKIEVVTPKVPVVQGGSMELKVVATRKEGFKGPINLKTLWDPPGVTAGSVTIPPDKTEMVMPLNAAAGATPKKWKTAVLASGDGEGAVWVSSGLTDLEVAPPFATMKLERTVVKQGATTKVNCAVEQKTPFEGKAKVELLGLPNEVTAPVIEIDAGTKEFVFDLTTTEKSPAGTHNGLLCRMTVIKDGEPIVHNLANGGILRIDAPKKAEAAPQGETKADKLKKMREGK